MRHGKFAECRPQFWAGGFLFDSRAVKVLLHLRDDRTAFRPGKWAFFGGLNQGSESFGECFIRELYEEIGLRVEPDEVRYLRDYPRNTIAQHRAVFYVPSAVPVEELTLGEGAGLAWLRLDKLCTVDITDATRADLECFAARREQRLRTGELRIIRARERSLTSINTLIAQSKAFWAWPSGYLEQALTLHRLDAHYLRQNHAFEILDIESRLVGFFSVAVRDDRVLLENLWITPERIGQGIGARACEYLLRQARERKWREISVLPDPPSEGFYLRMGFVDTGERVPSRVAGGPVYCVYRVHL